MRYRVPMRRGDDEKTPRNWFIGGLLVAWIIVSAFLVGSCIVDTPPKVKAAWLDARFTVPDRYADNGQECGLPDSALVDSTGALLLGSPMSSVRMAYLWGYLFRDPGGTGPNPTWVVLDSMDVVGFAGLQKVFQFWVNPGDAGVVSVTIANFGRESCRVGGKVFAIPAIDSTAPLSDALRYYDLTWKRP